MSRREFDVKLNVYDLVPRANRWLGAIGVGAYHSGVEVNGQEYFFAQGGGICQCAPRSCTQVGAFKEDIPIGDHVGTAGSIRDIIAGMRASWGADSYDLVRKNCNNFATDSTICSSAVAINQGGISRRSGPIAAPKSGGVRQYL